MLTVLAVDGISQSPRGTRFRELASRLRHDIDHGVLAVGSRLPSVSELAKASGLGMNTVRHAVSILVDEGLLDRRQGSGTFVVATSADRQERRSLGVLVPSLTYYYPQVIAGIEQAASSQRVDLVIACSYYDVDRELREVTRLVDAGVDGLLLVPSLHRCTDPTGHLAKLADVSIPYVLVERRAPDSRTSYVCTDITSGAHSAVTHLAGLGRHRIGHIGYQNSAPGGAIYRGYVQAMEECGLDVIDGAVLRERRLTMKDVGRYAETCRDLELDAVFCLGDPFAATLVRHLRKDGVAVPDDIAVVTFDDEFAHLAEVPLTAVAPPKLELGRLSTELLMRQVELGAAAVPYQVQLQPRLVVRASCGATPTSTLDFVFEAIG